MGLSYSFVSTKMYFTALVVNSFKLSVESIRINNLVFTRCIIRHVYGMSSKSYWS